MLRPVRRDGSSKRSKSAVEWRSSKKLRSGSSDLKQIRLYYKSCELDVIKSFLLDIPLPEFELFNNTDCSSYRISHSHNVGDRRFPTRPLEANYLSGLNDFPGAVPISNAVAVGSTVYSLYYGKLLSLDLDYKPQFPDDFQEFKEIALPPSSPSPAEHLGSDDSQMTSKLISVRDRLYYFGSKSKLFGEVYDPITNSWSALKEPAGVDTSKCGIYTRESLGDSTGEILLYGFDYKIKSDGTSWIYIYNVESGEWRIQSSTPELDGSEFLDCLRIGNRAVVKEDSNSTVLYWFDVRSRVHAFNWETMQVSYGHVVGIDQVFLRRMVKNRDHYFAFFHVSGDIFCMSWTVYKSYHITFLKVIEDDPAPGSLTAYVVGCIEYADSDPDANLCFIHAIPV